MGRSPCAHPAHERASFLEAFDARSASKGAPRLSYSIPAILLADSTVLSSNIAIVIGPTPPGTGLIQPAF